MLQVLLGLWLYVIGFAAEHQGVTGTITAIKELRRPRT